MKKASEYRRHAEECRQLVRTADSEEHRELLRNMATTWDLLADERERKALKAMAEAAATAGAGKIAGAIESR
jgi:hypothetical protein